MAKQKDIDRAIKGKDAWNIWAKEELKKPKKERAEVDFTGRSLPDINFSGFVFPWRADFKRATFELPAYFKGAIFKELAFFEGATFKSRADFEGTKFKEWANFEDVKFKGVAYFEGAMFNGLANFKGAKFEGWATFDNATFKNWTVFTKATFQTAPFFHNADIHQNTAFSSGEDFFLKQFTDIESVEAERAYRTLKLAMSKYQSHTEEAGFFKLELEARALKEPWYRRWMYGAYGLFGDYGQSVLRPFFCWVVLGVAVFVLYALILGKPGEAFTVTMAHALPLIGAEKKAYYDALRALFPDGSTPFWFQISRALHMVASSFFIFLALLALRNRFKIK